MNIFIAEDRLEDYLHLRKMIEKWANINQVQIHIYYRNKLFYQLPDFISHCQIAFLDIYMPVVNGFDFAAYLRKWNTEIEIVFQSHSSLYGAKSYRLNALDYLLKPLQEKQVFQILDFILEKQQKKSLVYRQRNHIKKIKFDEIIYIQIKDHRTWIHCVDHIEMTYDSILKLKDVLDCRFVQCYRGYLVNIDYIKKVDKDRILLKNQKTIPLSRNYSTQIKERMIEQSKICHMKQN